MILHEKRKRFTHFKYEQRLALEYYLKGTSQFPKITNTEKLSQIFGKTRRSLQREIKRGLVEHETSGVHTKIEYNADYAQQSADYEMTAKGAPLKLMTDWRLVDIIKNLIQKEKYSPYAVIQRLNSNGWPSEVRFSEKTLYNYISMGIIPDLTVKDLPNKGVRFKQEHRQRRFSRAACALRSISNRPKEVNSRSEYGHWEIDTVKSAADTTTECALTLTERKSRVEIIRKMPDAKAESVVEELNKIEKELGRDNFKMMFKSITADGGSEFMDFDEIETSVYGGRRTVLYFAHPYSAFERGTNENHNRMIRRFFPKGTDFSRLNSRLFIDIQNWMNNYPRRILCGATPANVFRLFMGIDFIVTI